jgi:hypothetical protein
MLRTTTLERLSTEGPPGTSAEGADSLSLRELAVRHGTDKEGAHFYARWYERFLAHLRDRPITLLEIGVGGYEDPTVGGESLRMWKEYFPSGRIVAIDVYDKQALVEDRIDIVQGSQDDPVVLERLGNEYGPFDVIVDDGSHHSPHVIASFTHLFPHLTPDGIYVIEDLQTSYWPEFQGSHDLGDPATSMNFLKRLVDGLNHVEWDVVDYEPTTTDRQIESITFVHNMAFIQRGPNDEPSNLLPPHPRNRTHWDRRGT